MKRSEVPDEMKFLIRKRHMNFRGERNKPWKDAEWLENFGRDFEYKEKQEEVEITPETIKKILREMPNWKVPCPDFIQGFWLKNFKSIQERLKGNLQKCLENGNLTMWMTKERTIPMQKDKEKSKAASNYIPITYLPLVWKLLTGEIAEEIYGFWDTNLLLRQEQKGCRRKSRGTNDLFIDKMIMREVKIRKRNLSTPWIDYKKACDMVARSWIIDCLETVGTEKIRRPLAESGKSWRVDLTSGEENL